MRRERIDKAIELARDFVEAASELIHGSNYNEVTGSKLSGTVRRLSMELTRALAEMRKP